MKITRKRNLLNGAGIFAGSLTVAAVAVYFYSPVIGSHADTTTIGAEVNAMIALTTPENLRLEVTPSAAGATASDSITATVNTNSTYGYELYFSATDTDTSMTSETSSSTITSDFTTTSLANIPVNSWGYSLDDTDYSPIPTSENSTRIRSIEHLPTGNELATSIYFGTKVSTSLASGFYSDNVLFSAVALAPPVPTMQNFNATTMLPETGDSMELEDERDGTMYIVKRLADGKVWMTENLRIADKTITSEDSNIPSGETFTIPASDITAFTTQYGTSAAYLDDTYGGYYNFYTATAGWGVSGYIYGSSVKDICPKGWHIPGPYDEFQTLYENYRSSARMRGDPGFVFSGEVYNGNLRQQGSYGFFWTTSTDLSYDMARYLSISDIVSFSNHDRYMGFAVRCLAD